MREGWDAGFGTGDMGGSGFWRRSVAGGKLGAVFRGLCGDGFGGFNGNGGMNGR